MPQDLFFAVTEVLGEISRGVDETALDRGMRQVERLSGRGHDNEGVALFKQHVHGIRNAVAESIVAEKALNLLIDTTHDLSSTLELQELLRLIVTRARNLAGANLAWVTVLEKESGLFRTLNAEGYLSPGTATMHTSPDQGAVSLIMRTKSFFETQDYLGDTRFRHSPDLDRTFAVENITSLAGFPMLAEGEVHGFLFVADRYARKLSGRDISVLGSFALHAGVAMRNANAFRLLSEALDEAERSRKALVDYIQRVEASAAAHDEMTSLLASGAELQLFLQRMANQINGAIFLYDDELRIREEFVSSRYGGQLATVLKAGKIEAALLLKAGSQSRHTGRSVIVTSAGNEQCRAITLHSGTDRGETLVICSEGELDPIEIRNLERNAVALTIAKLWNEKRETERLIASSTVLRHLVLVTPPDPATISAVRDRLSLGADQPVMLGLVAISGLDRAAQTAVVRQCAAGTNLLVDLLDDTYLAVGPEPPLRAFLQKLARARSGWQAGGILSDPFNDLGTASVRFARMNQALQVLRRMTRLDRFVEQPEVNLFAKLFEAGDAGRIARYAEEILAPIERRAPRQKAELKRTLLCFFDSQYSIRRVADALGLHINTVRQRLDTLREATGGWDDPVRALELHVALRLDAIMDSPPEAPQPRLNGR